MGGKYEWWWGFIVGVVVIVVGVEGLPVVDKGEMGGRSI